MKNMTIPNAMSIFRILLIPVFCIVFLTNTGNPEAQYIWAGIILIVSGATDLFDGYVARKLNQVTDVGKLLDPLADKLTLAAVLVCVWMKFKDSYRFITPLFAAMLIKELIMVTGGVVLMKLGKKMVRAQWWGKAATAAFYLLMTAAVVVIGMDYFDDKTAVVAGLIGASAAIMIVALIFYVVLGIKILKGKGPEDDDQVVHVDNLRKGLR